MFHAVLELEDGTQRFIRADKHDGHMPLTLVWQTVDLQGQPLTRVFIHDPRKSPDGSGEYVPAYLETVSLTVEPEKES